MPWKNHFPGYLTNVMVIVGSCLMSLSHLQAQPRESEPPQLVPASTYAAMSLNMRAILKKVDLDDPLIVGLRQVSNVETGFLDDPKLQRTVVLFSSQLDEDSHSGSSSGVLSQFEAPISPQAYFDRMRVSKYYEFTREDYRGQQIHVPRLSKGKRTLREPSNVWLFPEQNAVASGPRHVVEQMIDGKSSTSEGKDLVSKLDPKAEMHFILESNKVISPRVLASTLGRFDPLPARLLADALQNAKRIEVLLNYADEVPVQVTIEMKDGPSMDGLMEQIKGLLAEASGILDSLEEHEIPREAAVQPPFLELIALGRTAVKELKLERDGTTIRLTLGDVKGLEKLPQAYLTMSMIQAAMSGP